VSSEGRHPAKLDDRPRKPAPDVRRKPTRRARAKQRVLQSTAVLPSFVTLLNGLAGFAAIHFATKAAPGSLQMEHLSNLRLGAWLLALAMVFDMLDGRVARMTRRTSDFGGQLDSLCDMISFGVAPAVLMLRTVVPLLGGIDALGHDWNLERVVWSVAAVYVACTAMRLARYNVENDPTDSDSHMTFSGLPSPGAAAAVASLVLLFERLTRLETYLPDWQTNLWFLVSFSIVLVAMTLCAGLLMVSRCRYVHVANNYIRGRRPFSYLVKLILLLLACLWQPFATLAVVACGFALSGPIWSVWRRVRGRRAGRVEGERTNGSNS
jgi:CDP-diacylglycerol---serine O-phosphatidyltransferase